MVVTASHPPLGLVLRWIPRHRKAPAELFPSPRPHMGAALEGFAAALERFEAALSRDPGRRAGHPAFGELTLVQWRRLHVLHFDHHLRQFGV